MRLLLLYLSAALLQAADAPPVLRAWLINPAAATASPTLRAILPDVQNLRSDPDFAYIESAGISLQSLGPLEAGGWEPVLGPRKFLFRIPLNPKPANPAPPAPLGVTGAFRNGVPIYTPISPVSWRDQNLWHLDAVAARQRTGQSSSPLLASLLESTQTHSPLIGFALDGFPVYGPYGWSTQNGDANYHVTRLSSGYRLRPLTRRATLPDGTELNPSQEGPPVNSEYPLGSFVEDYVFTPGSGDLDSHNGRFAKTPEYPNGTYAYFLATAPDGSLQYPYLIGETLNGALPTPPQQPAAIPVPSINPANVDLQLSAHPRAGQPVTLTFSVHDARHRNFRFLEKNHEQPIHLMVVSTDLAEFAHIHPALQPDDTWSVTHAFPAAGSFWLYADLTRPGESQTIARFKLDVTGPAPAPIPTQSQNGLTVKFTAPQTIRIGEDIPLKFEPNATDLEPYLGAWAHFMILSTDGEEFIHAHPLDDPASVTDTNPWQHSHTAPGPSPQLIETTTGFRKPGNYKLWAQFQRQGSVIAIPFVFKVLPAENAAPGKQLPIPKGAIPVSVTTAGFSPARLELPPGKPATLAFQRNDARSCANSVVFPELGIRKALPVGETVLIPIPPSGEGRELHFACGMNMYRGSLLIKQAK